MAPAKHEGCSGTRNLKDNISDLKAQIAANNKVRERRGAYTSFKKLTSKLILHSVEPKNNNFIIYFQNYASGPFHLFFS